MCVCIYIWYIETCIKHRSVMCAFINDIWKICHMIRIHNYKNMCILICILYTSCTNTYLLCIKVCMYIYIYIHIILHVWSLVSCLYYNIYILINVVCIIDYLDYFFLFYYLMFVESWFIYHLDCSMCFVKC